MKNIKIKGYLKIKFLLPNHISKSMIFFIYCENCCIRDFCILFSNNSVKSCNVVNANVDRTYLLLFTIIQKKRFERWRCIHCEQLYSTLRVSYSINNERLIKIITLFNFSFNKQQTNYL